MQKAESKIHSPVEEDLYRNFGQALFVAQPSADETLTLWVPRDRLIDVLQYLKPKFSMLYDLFGIDERTRANRSGQPASDFTIVYQLLSLDRNEDIRIKVALSESSLNIPTIISLWPNANWYEREVWDMFGVIVSGHPNLYRILLPPTWEGHALRKDHPARATEMGEFEMGPERVAKEQEALRFRPEQWGMKKASDDSEYMFLNLGPNHPSVHGVFRVALQLDGEVIIDSVPDIGYHHRGAEKMGERQTWHTFIPYTDRIDYLGGVMNNLAYIQSVEMLAGIEVPERAKIIRIMLSELFRISSHLVFYGTFVQDVGQMSPVFYMFA
ncbi:MAG: NADH-quinone oxidoreductase subunit C, partial [Pseudomonadales bacterium]